MPVKPKQEILDLLATSGKNMREVRTAFTQRELSKRLGEPDVQRRSQGNVTDSFIPKVEPKR